MLTLSCLGCGRVGKGPGPIVVHVILCSLTRRPSLTLIAIRSNRGLLLALQLLEEAPEGVTSLRLVLGTVTVITTISIANSSK